MQLFNSNVLITLQAETTALGNGLCVKETRGKRDIVSGTVVESDGSLQAGTTVYFPLYAASSITIDGEEYVVVNFKDIILAI